MEPKVRIWVDARGEKFKTGVYKEEIYHIQGLKEQVILNNIYQAIGYYVVNLALLNDEDLQVTYDTEIISVSFIDYLLKQHQIIFNRENC
jgi:hypothetical protein